MLIVLPMLGNEGFELLSRQALSVSLQEHKVISV